LDATPDGRTLVVRSKPEGSDPYQVSVVTGAMEGEPRSYTLPDVPESEQGGEVSPDGRHYAVAIPDGTVWLWRLDGKGSAPTRLGRGLTGELDTVSAELDFSADGSRLLRMLDIHTPYAKGAKPRAFLDVWELSSLKSLPVADTVVSTVGDQSVEFGESLDTVVVTTERSEDSRMPNGSVVRDLSTGRALRKVPTPAHDWISSDATGAYGFETLDGEKEGYADVALGRQGTDDTYVTRLPVDDEPSNTEPVFAVARHQEDGLMVLSPVGNTLVTAYAHPAPRPVVRAEMRSLLAPDGRRIVRLTDREVQVVDLARGSSTAAELPRPDGGSGTWNVAWTSDSKRLVLWQSAPRLFLYEADALSSRLDVPLDTGDDTGDPEGVIDAVEPLPSGDVAVLLGGGALLRVDPDRGVQTGAPLRVDRSPVVRKFPPVLGQLRGRPANPHQVAVVTRNDTAKGRIQIWDIRARKQTEELKGDEISTRFEEGDPSRLAFSPDGRYLMVEHNDARLHRWDIATRKVVGQPITMEVGDDVVGMTNSGLLVTAEVSGSAYKLWRADNGAEIGRIPSTTDATAVLRGSELIVASDSLRNVFDLRPDVWFTHLCKNLGRDFTEAERAHLPPGTPPEAPCTSDTGADRGAG
jgi:WD40 repeat protein